MSTIPSEDPTKRLILRHLIATTIAYRAGKGQTPPVPRYEFD